MTQDPLAWLYGLERFGIKLGLATVRGLLAALGRPDSAYPSVLVGGTNGKGSVAAALDSIFAASGLATGLYTSPHLVRTEERIRIRGADISTAALARQLDLIRSAIAGELARGALPAHPSFFEVMTAAALLAFREARIDLAILEVGLGGRLDATNATDPVASVVVSVDLDHTDRLGATVEEIAAEKAGIARAGRPLVSGVARPEARRVLLEACGRARARFVDARTEGRILESPDGSFSLATARATYDGLRVALAGRHQVENARVAVVAGEQVAAELGRTFSPGAVRTGLAKIRWAGRLQWIDGDPPLLLDGAHNPAGAESLAEYLRGRGGRAPVLLFGATQGKDVPAILGPLRGLVSVVVLTRSSVERGLPLEELCATAAAVFPGAFAVPVPAEGLREAQRLARGESFVLVAGSLYLVGEVLRCLSGEPGRGPISL